MKPDDSIAIIDDVDLYSETKVGKGCGDDNPYAK